MALKIFFIFFTIHFVLVIINILMGPEFALITSKHTEELLQIFSQSVKRIFETTNRLYNLPVHWCERLNLKVWRDFKESVDLSLHLGNYLYFI